MRTSGRWRASMETPARPPHGLLRRLLRRVPPRLLRRIAVLAAGAAGLVAASTTLLLTTLGQDGPAAPPTECRQPLAMNVLVSADLEQTIAALAARFQQARPDGAGCPKYAMTVYSASPGNVRQAFQQQWTWRQDDATSQYFQPTRDVGPQPAIWIPGSSAEAWLAGGVGKSNGSGSGTPSASNPPVGRALQISVGDPLAWTRPVVAVPPALADQLPGGPTNHDAGSWQWSVLLPALQQAGGRLVRPNPTSSSIGLLHTIALYSVIHADDDIRTLENAFNDNIQKDNYPVEDDGEMLCRYAAIAQQDTHTALLVSDRSLSRYLAGQGNCGSQPAPLVRLVLDGVPAMDHPFVTVNGSGRKQAPRQAAARDFEQWLRSDAGAQDLLGAATGGDPATVAESPQTRMTMDTYRRQRALGRVLIALENSKLMMTEAPGALNEGSPLEAAKSAITQVMTLLGSADEVGLLTFNARYGSPPVIRTPVGLGRLNDKFGGQSRRSLLTAMNGTVADAEADQSPLYDVIERGLSDLAGNRHGTDPDVSALVVITDGRTIYGEKFAQLQTRLGSLRGTAGAVPVHVLAFHSDVCKDLNGELARTVGGSCLVTAPGKVAIDLRTRLAGLWKGAGT